MYPWYAYTFVKHIQWAKQSNKSSISTSILASQILVRQLATSTSCDTKGPVLHPANLGHVGPLMEHALHALGEGKELTQHRRGKEKKSF